MPPPTHTHARAMATGFDDDWGADDAWGGGGGDSDDGYDAPLGGGPPATAPDGPSSALQAALEEAAGNGGGGAPAWLSGMAGGGGGGGDVDASRLTYEELCRAHIEKLIAAAAAQQVQSDLQVCWVGGAKGGWAERGC